jgi:hypothetical protein
MITTTKADAAESMQWRQQLMQLQRQTQLKQMQQTTRVQSRCSGANAASSSSS